MVSKKFVKSKNTFEVTFTLPEGIDAQKASVAGDFNSWDASQTPMKKSKGVWQAKVTGLEQNREYQFRYVVNDTEWLNDPTADKQVANNVGGENSVVSTYPS
jgi:1,4-alpha-glucan branching enzyme